MLGLKLNHVSKRGPKTLENISYKIYLINMFIILFYFILLLRYNPDLGIRAMHFSIVVNVVTLQDTGNMK